ncbi:MAG: cbb3-type cytochrome oxidase assembly protein CcoS [Marinobacter sp.]|uniref:cbb3-type cytochrome oxidase assembly protein CcoS n=1 Tax=Marinobacter sp. TaxID=50741 RepID=UPI00299D1C37|nr:cbb3-type cytochrome oxidase assembly protein CcoS [Marinobacter sp.]MDX1635719.1 cbb3-type cytochrome oxidase assembly protein CcoS [Marinobacter sp.]
MKIVLILVPITLILVAMGIVLFSWAVRNGQYDDLDGPAHRILYDDDKDMIPEDSRQDRPSTGDKASATDQDRQPTRGNPDA